MEVKPMDVRLQDCFLSVDDHDKAIAFYRGARRRQRLWHALGHRGTALAARRQHRARASGSRSRHLAVGPGGDQRLARQGLLRGLNFSTPDLDGTFERVEATGAEVIQEPMDQAYGVRDCAFRDPAGNQIRISQTRG